MFNIGTKLIDSLIGFSFIKTSFNAINNFNNNNLNNFLYI